MNPIAEADEWLIANVFEPLSWHTEYHYRKNCFSLAHLCMTGTVLLWTFETRVIIIVFPVFLVPPILAWFSFSFIIREFERSTIRRKRLNHLRDVWSVRILVAVVSLMLVPSSLSLGRLELGCDLSGGLLLTATFYFLSCNLMPPRWAPKKKEAAQKLALQPT